MRRLLLSVLLCLILTLGLAATTQAAPNLSTTEGGTLSVFGESIFGVIYYGGVTYTIVDGCGLGIGTMLNDAAFELYVLNGTLTLGPAVLDIQAVTDTSFDEYLGKVGAYFKLDLGSVALFPGVGMLFVAFDLDDNGVTESDEIIHGDPFFAAEVQFKAGQLLVYGNAMMSFGDDQLFLGQVGVSLAF